MSPLWMDNKRCICSKSTVQTLSEKLERIG
jgi:hypothetical protein